jgi:P-type Cu2+ transporter
MERQKQPEMDQSKMDHTIYNGATKGMAGQDHHKMMITDFKKCFYIVLALTVPIMLLSTMILHLTGLDWQIGGSSYILFGLSTIVFRRSAPSWLQSMQVC